MLEENKNEKEANDKQIPLRFTSVINAAESINHEREKIYMPQASIMTEKKLQAHLGSPLMKLISFNYKPASKNFF